INMEKTDYNHFVSTNLGTSPLKVRITDIRGKVVKDTIKKLPENGTSSAYTVPGKVQFPD
ncbi:Expansin-YoaJ, partial [Bacillus haynesii]|nr:Expansin-YoaJ [Bacillus haynesii]